MYLVRNQVDMQIDQLDVILTETQYEMNYDKLQFVVVVLVHLVIIEKLVYRQLHLVMMVQIVVVLLIVVQIVIVVDIVVVVVVEVVVEMVQLSLDYDLVVECDNHISLLGILIANDRFCSKRQLASLGCSKTLPRPYTSYYSDSNRLVNECFCI